MTEFVIPFFFVSLPLVYKPFTFAPKTKGNGRNYIVACIGKGLPVRGGSSGKAVNCKNKIIRLW